MHRNLSKSLKLNRGKPVCHHERREEGLLWRCSARWWRSMQLKRAWYYDRPTSNAPLLVFKPLCNPESFQTSWFVAAMYLSIGGAMELCGPTRSLLEGLVAIIHHRINPSVQSKPQRMMSSSANIRCLVDNGRDEWWDGTYFRIFTLLFSQLQNLLWKNW